MKKVSIRLTAVLLVMLMLLTVTSCGKENTSSLTDEQQAVSALTGTTAGFGTRLKLTYPDISYTYGKEMTFLWEGKTEGYTFDLKLEKKEGDSYVTVFEKTGLTGTSYKYEKAMENADYRVTLLSVDEKGEKKEAVNTKDGGFAFTHLATVDGTAVNADIDYTVDGKVSLEVLNNYLNRTMTYCIYPDGQPWASEKLDAEFTAECLRGILSVGAKYITRTLAEWGYCPANEKGHADLAKWFERAHQIDPDIVFEACIFETVHESTNEIEIPDWVFEAFGKKPIDTNFDYREMIFTDGYGFEQWGEGLHIPDITREQTQMFFYYRACRYIDMGIESIHFGQTNLVGKNDTNNKCWTKLIKMIREYAKEHARRGYIFINCHYPDQNFVGTDGVMLADFNAFPMRLRTAKDEVDHAVSENNPQRCDFYPGEKMLYGESNYVENDAPYLKHIKGTSPSGWTTNNYPYLLEFDNFGNPGDHISKVDRFGYDEISWFANQPDWYRRDFLQKSVNKLVGLKDNGHLAMPGRRTAYINSLQKAGNYCMNYSSTASDGYDDEDTIRAIYAKLK